MEADINSKGYDIVGITETWLGEEDGEEYIIEGHKLIRKDRIGKRGGGEALYVKDNLNVYEIPEMDQRRPGEDLWIRLTGEDEKGFNLRVGYRPPASDSNENARLFENIKQACRGGEIIIMGDFNYPGINWESVTEQGIREEQFLDVVNYLF